MKKHIAMLLMFLGFSICSSLAFSHSSETFSQVNVSIGDINLTLDYANTPKRRAHGLQHKKVLCNDCGMLFEFEYNRVASFWMKNTFLPLDIAFIKKNGEIVHIAQMQPFDLIGESSVKPVLYAIEMNQNWFTEKGIKVGDSVTITLSK